MIIQSIETERLLIRPFQAEDWVALYAYTSNPAVMAYIPEGVMNETQAQAFVHQNQQAESVTAYALLCTVDK